MFNDDYRLRLYRLIEGVETLLDTTTYPGIGWSLSGRQFIIVSLQKQFREFCGIDINKIDNDVYTDTCTNCTINRLSRDAIPERYRAPYLSECLTGLWLRIQAGSTKALLQETLTTILKVLYFNAGQIDEFNHSRILGALEDYEW